MCCFWVGCWFKHPLPYVSNNSLGNTHKLKQDIYIKKTTTEPKQLHNITQHQVVAPLVLGIMVESFPSYVGPHLHKMEITQPEYCLLCSSNQQLDWHHYCVYIVYYDQFDICVYLLVELLCGRRGWAGDIDSLIHHRTRLALGLPPKKNTSHQVA